jgi:hypothetical protein
MFTTEADFGIGLYLVSKRNVGGQQVRAIMEDVFFRSSNEYLPTPILSLQAL